MKPAWVVSALVVLGGVAATAIFWPHTPPPATPGTENASGVAIAGAGAAGASSRVATNSTNPDKAQSPDRCSSVDPPKQESAAGTLQRASGGRSRPVGPGAGTARAASAGRRSTTSGSGAGGTPRVSAELAFKALLYVGVDPEAEKTWMQAINDKNLPEGVRSDLIEDLNDEGYEDPSGNNITKKDLPLILARMEIIERLAPYAMDKVNADAFEEAYKDLLNMYVRLKSSGE
jgi:hypothetical protein